jgi:hypothetical protein
MAVPRHGGRPAAALGIAFGVSMGLSCPARAEERLFLSLGSRAPAARVVDASGLGTAAARATGRVQPAEAHEACAAFITDAPERVRDCARGWMTQFAAPVHASADCMAGTLRATDGAILTYAGEWPSDQDVGVERSKWRGADGRVLGAFSASGAGTASAQWATLCGPRAKPGHPTVAAAMRERAARRSNGTPADAFRHFVSFDRRGGSDLVFAARVNPTMARLLSAALARDWVRAVSRDEPVFDASPFNGRQNAGFSRYTIVRVYESDDSTAAQVEAVLDTPEEAGARRHKQLYMFVNEDRRWKLNEINYDPDGKPRFLHIYLQDVLRRPPPDARRLPVRPRPS